MKISILTSKSSWFNLYLDQFRDKLKMIGHDVAIVASQEELSEGDIAFFLSCFEVVEKEKLRLHKNNLVVHASELPAGKGWSPVTWQILEGKMQIPVCLFEATEKMDAGNIYLKKIMKFNGLELVEEIRKLQAQTTMELCLRFLEQYPDILLNAQEQQGEESFYRKRKKEDSRLDVDKSLKEQFNLLRVVDNDHYPAFFEIKGQKYKLKIEKIL